MDPISTKLAEESIDVAMDAAKGFLSKLVGPAVEEIGLLLQDNVKLYRLRNQLKIIGKAKDMLRLASLEPNAVPFRTLLPILEGAALEDDEVMSNRWAALLANAASGISLLLTHPSFPRILSELTPHEAVYLDRLESQGGKSEWNSFRIGLTHELGVTEDNINRYFGNLFRLGLINNILEGATRVNYTKITIFGETFLSACKPPIK
jgi:hypothetical protein